MSRKHWQDSELWYHELEPGEVYGQVHKDGDPPPILTIPKDNGLSAKFTPHTVDDYEFIDGQWRLKRAIETISPIAQIKAKYDICEVISRYTTLRGRNNQYWGLCPLHGDKIPSLSVDKEKQLWHCFGCGKGGDIIDFAKEVEKCDTRGAIRIVGGANG